MFHASCEKLNEGGSQVSNAISRTDEGQMQGSQCQVNSVAAKRRNLKPAIAIMGTARLRITAAVTVLRKFGSRIRLTRTRCAAPSDKAHGNRVKIQATKAQVISFARGLLHQLYDENQSLTGRHRLSRFSANLL